MLQLLFNGLVTGLLVALPALALALSYSVLRFANFAIGAMLTLGAYLIYFFNVNLGLSLPLAATLGAVSSALAAALIDILIYRPLRERSGVTLLVASMGVAFIVENAVRFLAGGAPRGYAVETARPLRFAGVRVNHEQLLILALSLTSLLLVWVIFRYTRLGRAMRAIADNAPLAAVRGVSREKIVRVTWLISGALTAIAGLLIGLDTTLDPQMGWNYILPVFAAAILGGITNPMAAVAGALIMGVAAETSTLLLPPHYRNLVAFTILAALLLIRPWGIFGQKWVLK